MSTFLIHADTGRIAAMRTFSWPAYFLNHVIASVHQLHSMPYTEPAAHAAQLDFYRRYPDGPSLYRLVKPCRRTPSAWADNATTGRSNHWAPPTCSAP